ncbi:tRNA uridine-5-carboxymethylaminomethyl(34) synthesis GTPase MnmE [Jannaschia aquimarina]|uniref:tRNA modification GTPase MnmE n=1 Tax=Jannaschia aquimarina TaxID=935700 RepID=A0A0D1CJR4_9RHOB|nr:tRNA uridine-5-carboxymethylaminomethyl(34) synthesis GTPase MnmE [Jannaschia aquimarina]KIT14967.1 tRNA modification GTPase MnmE [Jannaschia aquimarina]SNS60695.1 tRNA modification GTPase trmE [Jannaschia aquimarina]
MAADTIHAPATAPGKAGVAVVRVSGPSARTIAEKVAGTVPKPRYASLRLIRHPDDGTLIDRGLVLFFPGPDSFTAEDVVEFQIHGGPAIVDAVLESILATGLSRVAEPGEFTRRAHENGKLDIVQVHALSDAIEAETELQRVFAMRRLEGEAGERFRAWRDDLLFTMARLEASIDFSDEDLPADVLGGLKDRLVRVSLALREELDGFWSMQRLREGFRVTILGRPNAGKSSLINKIVGEQRAIVSSTPGTTRDVIESRVDLNGIPVVFVDTAGLRETSDEVESIGVALALKDADRADLRIVLVAGNDPLPEIELRDDDLLIRSKRDLYPEADVSALTGDGIATLVNRITSVLRGRIHMSSGISRRYEYDAMSKAQHHISEVIEGWDAVDVEILLAKLYPAVQALGRVIGDIDLDDLLDEIFSSFCLGK